MAIQKRYLFGTPESAFQAYLTYDDVTHLVASLTVFNNDSKDYIVTWIWSGISATHTITPGFNQVFVVPAHAIGIDPDGAIRTPVQLTSWGLTTSG